MGWSLGYDDDLKRDVGYGVPAYCDHPGCDEVIDRGLSYVCGSDMYGGERGCGMHFCEKHRHYHERLGVQLCARCERYRDHFPIKPDHPDWIRWKLTDESWKQWRDENPEEVKKMQEDIFYCNHKKKG